MEEKVILKSNTPEKNYKNINNVYGIICNYLTKDLKIHYNLTIKFLKISEKGLPVFEINRSQLFLNNSKPDFLLYEMADKMIKTIYPIQFSVINDNEIEAIENYSEILNRCQETEIKLKEYYKGETAQKIISNFNKQYNQEETIKEELQNNLFYAIIFFITQKNLTLQYTKVTNFKFSVEGKKINLPVYQEIEPYFTESKKIKINVLGLENNQNITAFKINYRLNENDYSIFSATGKVGYELRKEKTIFEFECYKIN